MSVFSFGLSAAPARRSSKTPRVAAARRQNETKILFPSQYGTYILFLNEARFGAMGARQWRNA
jgi:hypothetical protein